MTMSGGYGGGGGGWGPVQQLQQDMAQLRSDLNQHAQGVRGMAAAKLAVIDQKMTELAQIAQAMKMSRSGLTPGVVRVEDIPGRRVPFVLLIDIPIEANMTSLREQSVTISQDGPFVAVKRMATFQSAFEFQVTDPDDSSIGRFQGRTFGRYRPIHSAWDLNDAGPIGVGIYNTTMPDANFGINFPNIASGGRSMGFDGRLLVYNAGSSYPRQNLSVPTSMWSPSINAPQDLGCLDFFERGEALTVQVQANHVNNPAYGNVSGLAATGTDQWPFLAGQFDPHEGIFAPGVITDWDPVLTFGTTDPIVRLPNGILTVAWEGYRIIQGPGSMG